jgi:hypothetical protein
MRNLRLKGIMEYRVFGYSVSHSSPHGSVLTSVVRIDKARYDYIEKSKATCLLVIGFEERFQLVIDNFFEWEAELLSLAQRRLIWRSIDRPVAMQRRLLLDRRLANFLTVCRLYLDQTDHGVSQCFGKGSAELRAIKAFKSTIYDSNFGYRFLEALRSYVQHCGLAVHIFEPRESLSEPFSGIGPLPPSQISVVPGLRFDLIQPDEFKKNVLEEAMSFGPKIDLRSPVRNYVDCLVQIHAKLREIYANLFSESRRAYLTAVAEYATLDGHPVQNPKLQRCQDSGDVDGEIELPPDIFAVYDALYSRNSEVEGVSSRFVSSSLQKEA